MSAFADRMLTTLQQGLYWCVHTQMLEKKNHDLAPPQLAAYTLTLSFSNASHQCGHDLLSPIAVYTDE